MAHWTEKADLDVRGWVARWCFSTDQDLSLPWTVSVEPDGRSDLVFSVESVPASCGERPTRGEAWGIKTRPVRINTTHPTETIAVQLRPGGLHRFFGVSAHELTDRHCDLDELWSSSSLDLLRRLGGAETFVERKALIGAALRLQERMFRTAPGESEVVRAAITLIERTEGRLPVIEVVRRLDQHPRTLERLFRRHVGVSPKRYARLVRFNQAKQRIAAGYPLASVAATLGYCDQAHLCRDFRSLAGRTPTQTEN